MITKTTFTTKRTTTYQLDGQTILNVLIEAGLLSREDLMGAEVTFRVPGGGDWSNARVDVDADNPVTITVHTTETT